MKRLLYAGFALSLSVAANAGVTFSKGDVFVGKQNGTIQEYSPTGTLLQTLNTGTGGEETGMAFNNVGTLHGTSFGSSTMYRFDVNGTMLLPNPWLTNDAGSHNESVVFDSSGNFYVGQADGTHHILKRDPSGALLASYNVATDDRGSDWVDLASDQHTLFYTSEGNLIKRFDTTTSTQLPDFASLPAGGIAFALRLLGDGGLLVADWASVKRLDALGNVIQTYDTPSENNFFALNLDPNGTSFWSAGYYSGSVYKFDIATGAVQETIATGPGVSGLAVYGEITQGKPSGVPDTGATALLLALGLAALAAARSRVVRRG